MFRRGRRKMSKEEAREQELRQTVAQLKEQLEEEKRARKRDHGDKVREVKAAREREQELSREAMDELKLKHQREKAQEMNALMERMTKDFKNQQKELMRRSEEEKQQLQRELEKERKNIKEQRKSMDKELQKQLKQVHETEQKKVAQEMFAMSCQLNDMEEKLRHTRAADQSKAEVIRDMKAEHHSEIENLSHSSRLSSRQQVDELKASQRELKEKDKEISSNLEKIRRLESDKEKLVEEVRNLRQRESWAKSSVVSPPLSPATSSGDITSQQRQYSQHERDLVLRNTELGHRVRQLETKNTELDRYKKELKDLLEKTKGEQKPLKEQIAKQGARVNNLNATILDKEKQAKKLTEENDELKKANQELAKEQAAQKRRLTQQMNQTHVQRMEHQKAVGKVSDLQKANRKLSLRLKDLELQLRTRTSGISGSSSPTISIASLTSAPDESGTDNSAVKYREMKSEYMKLKDHYKTLKTNHDKLEQKYRLSEHERLEIEAEISALRATPPDGRDSPYDIARSTTLLSHNQTHIETLQSRIQELETYIMEQDKSLTEEKERHSQELSSLAEEREQLLEKLQTVKSEEREVEEEEKEKRRSMNQELLDQLNEVETMNRKTSVGVKEAQQKVQEFDEGDNEMDETIQGLLKLDNSRSSDEEEEETEAAMESQGSFIVMKRAQQAVRECRKLLESGKDASQVLEKLSEVLSVDKPVSLLEDSYLALGQTIPVDSSTPSAQSSLMAEITRLKEELSQKQEAVETAQSKVDGLQELVSRLEEELEEGQKERETLTATWEHNMTKLQTQLSQKETQLKRVRRAIPQGVNEHMHQELGQKVLLELQQCKSVAGNMEGSETLLSELEKLETSLHSLLHTVFPGMFQQHTISSSSSAQALHDRDRSPSQPIPAPDQNGFESHLTNETSTTTSTTHPSDTVTPSEVPPSSYPSSRHIIQADDVVVTPLSSASSSPIETPTQSPDIPLVPHESPQGQEHQLSQPSTPPPSPQITPTPPEPIEEVMVSREVPCEEITIPLSSLLQTTPTDSTHPHNLEHKHLPPDPNISEQSQILMSQQIHKPLVDQSDPDDSKQPQMLASHNKLVDQSEDGPEQIPRVEIGAPEEEQAVEKRIHQTDIPLFDGMSQPLMPGFTFTGGREYTHEDLDEVDLGTSGEYSVGAETRSVGGWTGRDSMSPPIPASPQPSTLPVESGPSTEPVKETSNPSQSQTGKDSSLPLTEGTDGPSPSSLYYPTPPEAPAARQRLFNKQSTGASPSSLMFGKKRLRTESMEQEELKDEEDREKRSGRMDSVIEEKTTTRDDGKERLFVAILSYDPEAMCTTGRPDLELFFDEGAIIAVAGSVDESGFYRGSFQGRNGLVPAGFVQEMEVEDKEQQSRLLNQTLTRPHIPSLPPTPLNTPISGGQHNNSHSLFSPSGTFLAPTSPGVRSPHSPSSIIVESTRQRNVVAVSWQPPASPGSEVTGYHIFANKQLRASVSSHQTRVLLPEVSEVSPIVVGVASHDQYGKQSSVASATYNPAAPSPPSHPPPTEHEQYRLCIALLDYDPYKMSPSDNYEMELKVAEGNLLRCYSRDNEEDGFTMAELAESNKRGLVLKEFITEVYGPSDTDPNKYEWKSPPPELLPASSKKMKAVFDYNSRQDSPNRDMELELSFRNGDTITIYGSMDTDGFYTGQVGEVFGLVPSNFLHELETPVILRDKKTTEGRNRTLARWELPPNMWSNWNGQEVNGIPMTQSDEKNKVLARPNNDHNLSTSEHSSETDGIPRRRWSNHIPFRNPFSRKKSDSFL